MTNAYTRINLCHTNFLNPVNENIQVILLSERLHIIYSTFLVFWLSLILMSFPIARAGVLHGDRATVLQLENTLVSRGFAVRNIEISASRTKVGKKNVVLYIEYRRYTRTNDVLVLFRAAAKLVGQTLGADARGYDRLALIRMRGKEPAGVVIAAVEDCVAYARGALTAQGFLEKAASTLR